MDSSLLGGIFSGVSDLLGKFIPDKDTLVQAQLELAKLQDGAAERADQLSGQQIEVDKIEAANPNIFVSGWRPFLGWTGGVIMAWTFMVAPIIHTFWPTQPIPAIDATTVMQLILALLGIGGTLRTVEKLGGVATASAVPQITAPQDNIVTRTVGKWFK